MKPHPSVELTGFATEPRELRSPIGADEIRSSERSPRPVEDKSVEHDFAERNRFERSWKNMWTK